MSFENCHLRPVKCFRIEALFQILKAYFEKLFPHQTILCAQRFLGLLLAEIMKVWQNKRENKNNGGAFTIFL